MVDYLFAGGAVAIAAAYLVFNYISHRRNAGCAKCPSTGSTGSPQARSEGRDRRDSKGITSVRGQVV